MIHVYAVSNPFVKPFISWLGRKSGLYTPGNSNDCDAYEWWEISRHHSRANAFVPFLKSSLTNWHLKRKTPLQSPSTLLFPLRRNPTLFVGVRTSQRREKEEWLWWTRVVLLKSHWNNSEGVIWKERASFRSSKSVGGWFSFLCL